MITSSRRYKDLVSFDGGLVAHDGGLLAIRSSSAFFYPYKCGVPIAVVSFAGYEGFVMWRKHPPYLSFAS